jgi:hypothetical protein
VFDLLGHITTRQPCTADDGPAIGALCLIVTAAVLQLYCSSLPPCASSLSTHHNAVVGLWEMGGVLSSSSSIQGLVSEHGSDAGSKCIMWEEFCNSLPPYPAACTCHSMYQLAGWARLWLGKQHTTAVMNAYRAIWHHTGLRC